jgi:hypothetical protein
VLVENGAVHERFNDEQLPASDGRDRRGPIFRDLGATLGTGKPKMRADVFKSSSNVVWLDSP